MYPIWRYGSEDRRPSGCRDGGRRGDRLLHGVRRPRRCGHSPGGMDRGPSRTQHRDFAAVRPRILRFCRAAHPASPPGTSTKLRASIMFRATLDVFACPAAAVLPGQRAQGATVMPDGRARSASPGESPCARDRWSESTMLRTREQFGSPSRPSAEAQVEVSWMAAGPVSLPACSRCTPRWLKEAGSVSPGRRLDLLAKMTNQRPGRPAFTSRRQARTVLGASG